MPTPTPPVVQGGNLTGAVISDALTLHPYKRNNQTGEDFLKLLYAASLTRLNPQTLQPEPAAAASWKIDGNTVTFTLKEGLKWSDGTPLTSADYLWTYQQARKPENNWPLVQAVFYQPSLPSSNGIESYEAPDPNTILVKLHAASSDMVRQADNIQPLPKHIWQNLDWNAATNPQVTAPTVVSGPWKLKTWQPGSSITFERNPNSSVYPAPRLDSLTFKVVADSQVALQKLKAGEIDFYRPSPADFASFAALPNVQTYTWGPAGPTWYFAGFNFRKPYLQDKILRQALDWSLDRRSILQKQGFGLGQLINSDIPPWSPFFNPNTARYDFNLDKAKALLQQAGYSIKDGKLLDKTGKALPALKLVYNAPSPLYEGIANTMKTSFAALGVQVELSNFDSGSYQSYLLNPASDYDIFLSGWTTNFASQDFGQVWSDPSLNSGAYENGQLLGVYSKAMAETDPAKIKNWLFQSQAIEAEELPYIFLYAEQGLLVTARRVAGFSTNLPGPTQNLYSDWFMAS